jgi:hypothetical protein
MWLLELLVLSVLSSSRQLHFLLSSSYTLFSPRNKGNRAAGGKERVCCTQEHARERAQTHTHTPRATKKQQTETRAPRAKKKHEAENQIEREHPDPRKEAP